MNTTVVTVDTYDFGAGPNQRQIFSNCKWHVDQGTVHIVREGGRGNVASFAPGAWRAVLSSDVIVAAEVQR